MYILIRALFRKNNYCNRNQTNLLTQTSMKKTSKILRENWFKGYRVEKDVDVFPSLPMDECTEDWE